MFDKIMFVELVEAGSGEIVWLRVDKITALTYRPECDEDRTHVMLSDMPAEFTVCKIVGTPLDVLNAVHDAEQLAAGL